MPETILTPACGRGCCFLWGRVDPAPGAAHPVHDDVAGISPP